MRQSRRRRLVFAALTTTGILSFAEGRRLLPPKPFRSTHQRSIGRYTFQEVQARSEALCRLLAPQAGGLHVEPARFKTYTCEGAARYHWIFDYTDDAGNYLVHLDWSEESGALCNVSCPAPLQSGRTALDRRQAVACACDCLNVVGFADESPYWRVTGEPIRRGNTWTVCLQSTVSQVLVEIDAYWGTLVYVRRMPWTAPAGAHQSRL